MPRNGHLQIFFVEFPHIRTWTCLNYRYPLRRIVPPTLNIYCVNTLQRHHALGTWRRSTPSDHEGQCNVHFRALMIVDTLTKIDFCTCRHADANATNANATNANDYSNFYIYIMKLVRKFLWGLWVFLCSFVEWWWCCCKPSTTNRKDEPI